MFNLNRSLLFIFTFIAGISAGQADEMKNLYEARVSVQSQDREERISAIRSGLGQVLIRISGRADILQVADYPSIRTAIENPTRYAQQFRYLKSEQANTPLILWVRFDEQAINKLLQSNHLPVWGSTRPAMLVWLVVDDRGHRELIGNNTAHVARDALLQQARQRGVPLRLPLLDLNDRTNIRTSEVWGNFETNILRASERYQTEAVLVGRVFQGYGGYWSGRWSLYVDSRRRDWSFSGSSIQDVLLPSIDSSAEILASRYALIGQSDDGSVLVQIKNIQSLGDYNRVLAYLRTLTHVKSVQPYEIMANSAMFKLSITSGRLGLARAVSLGHTLVNEPVQTIQLLENPQQPSQVAQLIPDLIYRLVP